MKRRRWLLLGLIYVALLVGGWLAGNWLDGLVAIDIRPQTEARLHRAVMTATALFVVTSALPFVPGAEIGFALLMMFGARIAFLVYLSMVGALTLGFLAGRLLPEGGIARVFDFLGLTKARDLMRQMDGRGPEERLELLLAKAPTRIAPTLLRHRYLALLVLFNLPGNSAIGGGGGIAFIAGMSGLFTLPRYLASVAVAVAPFPLYVTLAGRLG